MKDRKRKKAPHRCRAIAQSTGVRCQNGAWFSYKHRYYCGHHHLQAAQGKIVSKENEMPLAMRFVEGDPKCPVCDSHRFDATFELIGPGQWEAQSIYCYECNTEIKVTDELESFLRAEKWTVKG